MTPVRDFDYQNNKLKAIFKNIPESEVDGVEISFQMQGHHKLAVYTTEGLQHDVHVIPLDRNSPRNLSYYQDVWDNIYHVVGPAVNNIFETYKTQVYIHTGVFIQNKFG